MSVQSGLGPAGEAFALQEEENKKDLVLSSSEENKEETKESIEEKTDEAITDQSDLVEVTGKEEKKSYPRRKKEYQKSKS